MKLNSFDEVKRLTQEMVAIPSINKEPGPVSYTHLTLPTTSRV